MAPHPDPPGKAVALIVLATWTGFGAWLLAEQKAHGESVLPGLVVLGIGVLILAALLTAAIQLHIPPWRHGALVAVGKADTQSLPAGGTA